MTGTLTLKGRTSPRLDALRAKRERLQVEATPHNGHESAPEKPRQPLTDNDVAQRKTLAEGRRICREWVCMKWPDLFNEDEPKPLPIGIYHELRKQRPEGVSNAALRSALTAWTRRPEYHQTLIKSTHRHDLAGNAVQEITDAHRRHAMERLKQLEGKT